MTISFHLKNRIAKGKTPIYVLCQFDNQKLKFSLGRGIPPKYWDEETQKVKRNNEIKDYDTFNYEIDSIREILEDEYFNAKEKGVTLTSEYLRNRLSEFISMQYD